MQVFRFIALLLFVAPPVFLMADEKNGPPSYDLKVSIEPDAGSMTVRGSVEVPLQNLAATNFKFNLHETFTITKLTVNGKDARFAYAPMVGQLPLPASGVWWLMSPPASLRIAFVWTSSTAER